MVVDPLCQAADVFENVREGAQVRVVLEENRQLASKRGRVVVGFADVVQVREDGDWEGEARFDVVRAGGGGVGATIIGQSRRDPLRLLF